MARCSQCVAWNCTTRRRRDETDDPAITFHCFPMSKPEQCTLWLEQMGEEHWEPQRGSVVCSKHFDPECFLKNYATPRLKLDAVPTHFERRPIVDVVVDLDKHTADGDDIYLPSLTRKEQAAALNKRPRKKPIRGHDPEKEMTNLRQLLEEERTKRRALEQEIYKLRQEKSDLIDKMNKLENAKPKSHIPDCFIPMLVDAMAKKARKKTPVKKTTPKPSLFTEPPAPSRTTINSPFSIEVKPPPRKGQRTEGSDVSGEGGASKVMLQLPQQMMDSGSKSVSFRVPVSSSCLIPVSPSCLTINNGLPV